MDLLISSLKLERVGILDSHFLHPVVGGREDGQEGLTTPLEVYGRRGFPFHIIQQRSPVIKVSIYAWRLCYLVLLSPKRRKRDFVDALLNFIATSGFSGVLILSALDLSHRIDAHMQWVV